MRGIGACVLVVEIGSFPSHGQGHIKGCVLGVSVEKTSYTVGGNAN